MADGKEEGRPECFGRLDAVFPLGQDGLRHSPEGCLPCEIKTECLRTAVAGDEGATVHSERLERAYQAGMVGFLGRWALQKDLKQRGTKAGILSRMVRFLRHARPKRRGVKGNFES